MRRLDPFGSQLEDVSIISGDLALVLGGSGFIGSHLIRRLTNRGWRVRSLDVVPPRHRLAGVDYHLWDVRHPIPPALGAGVAAIFNLAALHRTPGHPDPAYYETNVAGALNAVALAEACDVPSLVFTSSIAVYGPCEAAVSEATPPRPVNAYGRSKRLAEGVHRRWRMAQAGRRLVVVRPGVVFGPGEGGNYTRLARALRHGYFAFPGRRDTVKSGGYVDELMATLEFALARPEPEIVYNFAYPQAPTIEEIVAVLGPLVGRSQRPPTLPLEPLLWSAQLFQVADRLGLRNGVHPDRVMKMVQSTRVTPGWLMANGYEFSTDVASALGLWREQSQGRFD